MASAMLTFSILFRCSISGALSLTSLPAAHVLIWSLNLCSFLISRFRLSSSLSFCEALVEVMIFS